MSEIDKIQTRCDAGRPIPRIDVKYLLAEVKRLTIIAEQRYQLYAGALDTIDRLRDENKDLTARTQPANEPLTLEQLRGITLGSPLWKEEPPRGDMTESRIEPVLFNGIHCGNEERACWVTCEAHHANARVEHIAAGEINFYLRKPEEVQ